VKVAIQSAKKFVEQIEKLTQEEINK